VILEPELRARLERLALRTSHRVRGRWWGAHRSQRTGDSLDFADYREYAEGDDLRRVDYNLLARLGVLLIRLFEAEDESPIRIVLDRSASMAIGQKWPAALKVAGVLGFLGLAAGDRVQPHVTPGSGGRPFEAGPPLRHIASWMRLEAWLEGQRPDGAAPLASATKAVAAGAPGPVILISDLMDPGWGAAVDRLSLGRGGFLLHVLDPMELRPDLAGDLDLVDVETGRSAAVSLDRDAIGAYDSRLAAFLSDAETRARRRGLEYLLVPATPDVADRLVEVLARRELVK
jgi:uncharacterized protein (DUF58 family)